jgi:hypothetical protein
VMVLRTVSGRFIAHDSQATHNNNVIPSGHPRAGGEIARSGQIAEGLRVSKHVVASWCDGTGTLSNTHLLRLADLLAKYADANR